MRIILLVLVMSLKAAVVHAEQKRDLVGIAPGMSITQIETPIKQFSAGLSEQPINLDCGEVDRFIKRFQQLLSANKLSESGGQFVCGGEDKQNPPTRTTIAITFTSKHAPGTVTQVDLSFKTEASSQQIVQQVSDQFAATSERLIATGMGGMKFAAFRWNLGNGVGLVLMPSCYSPIGTSAGVNDCQQAPRSQANSYRLTLADMNLIRLEQQAQKEALPHINPKPKF